MHAYLLLAHASAKRRHAVRVCSHCARHAWLGVGLAALTFFTLAGFTLVGPPRGRVPGAPARPRDSRAAVAIMAAGPPPNVLVATGRTEPVLALDPRDASRIVAAANPDYYNDNRAAGAPGSGVLVSHDGGVDWTRQAVPAYGSFTGIADPSLGVDTSGRIYYLSMGETPSFCGESGNVALLLARRRSDGEGFAAPTAVDVARSDDKPFVAVDSTGGHGVYITFTRWSDPYREILFTRSLDGGAAFTPPTVLYAAPGVNMGSLPVVGPHRHLYVLWAHYDRSSFTTPLNVHIMLRASTDGGRTFAPPVVLAAFTGLPRLLVPGALRLFTFPTAAVDPRNGTLYVAWVQARAMARPAYAGEMDADLMLTRSRDGGRTWTRPVALNDTIAGDRFMPALAVGTDGTVRVVFYDRRADHLNFRLYGVAARDLGGHLRIWPNRPISAALSSPLTLHYIAPGSTCVAPGRFMGDYIDAASGHDGALDVMWTDTARGIAGDSDLWFSRVPRGYLQRGTPYTARW